MLNPIAKKTCTCLRCGATWTPRKEKPVQCPRCKRVDWNKTIDKSGGKGEN